MLWVHVDEVEGIKLPGRVWKRLISPEHGPSKNMVLGVVVFPPGSDPGIHSHEGEEEIIYVLSGRGEIKVGDKVMPLEPGVAVFTEPGLEHGVRNSGEVELILISVFSPPVIPGSYDRRRESAK
jgi:quercetin dioxygenase-like cupin family protein